MKKRIVIAASIVTLVVAGCIYAAAGTHNAMGSSAFDGQQGPGERVGERHGRILEHIAAELKLTDAQKEQIKGIIWAERPTVQPLVQNLMQDVQSMRKITADGQFDEAQVRALAAQQGQTITELIVEKERVQSKIFAVLTPEQRTKAQEMLDRFMSRVGGRFMGAE